METEADAPKFPSEWHRLFAGKMSEHGLQARVADALGVYPSRISRIVNHGRKPDVEWLWTIQDITGIDPKLLSQPPKSDEFSSEGAA